MANTIKFGNGQWATKEDSILAYNDENANFKPLPFVTSRASTATRVNKSGLLETVASGVPRVDYLDNSKGSYLIEPSSTNLITQSESFGNSYWTKSGATIEGDASTVGVEKVVNGDFTGGTTGWTLGTGYTISGGVLNLTNVNSSTTQNSVWEIGKMYLVTVDYNFVSGTRLILPYDGTTQASIITSASSGTSSYYYTPSATTMYIYSDGNGNGSIDNVSVKEVQGFSAPSVDSPLGAFKLVESSANESHYLGRITTGLTTGGTYTTSIICKAGEINWLLYIDWSSTANSVYLDISNKAVGTKGATMGDVKFEDLADGFVRVSLTYPLDAAQSQTHNRWYLATGNGASTTYTGNGTSGVYIFGTQLEQQSYATSYIPTKGSQITRLSESASQTVPDGIIGQTEGTVYAEVNLSSIESMGVYCGWKIDGTSGNQLAFIIYPNGRIQATVFDGGSLVVNINDNNYGLTSGKHKIAFAYKQNDYILYVDGSVVGSDTSAAVPIVNDFDISYTNGGSLKYNQTKLYNTRLSNSELVKLTTI